MGSALDFLAFLVFAFVFLCGLIGAMTGFFVFRKGYEPCRRGLFLGFFTGLIVGMVFVGFAPSMYLLIKGG